MGDATTSRVNEGAPPKSGPAARVEAPSEHALWEALEHAPMLVAVLRGAALVFSNRTTRRHLELPGGPDALVEDVLRFVHEDDHERIAAVLSSSEPRLLPGEVRLRGLQGRESFAEYWAMPVLLGGEPAVLAIGRDVTQERELRARLAEADRLAALGGLARVVAHELNSPLAAALTSLELLSERAADAGVDALVSSARDALERVRRIVLELSVLSRPAGSRRAVPLDELWRTALSLVPHEHRARVAPLAPAPRAALERLAVEGDGARAAQALGDAVAGALEAEPAAGFELTMRRREPLDADGAREGGLRARLELRAEGLTGALAQRLLAAPQGGVALTQRAAAAPSLGLLLSHATLAAAGGALRWERAADGALVLALEVPVRELEPERPSIASAGAGRRLRVLVVDDDSAIRRVLERALGDEHEVRAAADGVAALAALCGEGDVDVVLCDLVMPEMGGIELYERVCEASPSLGPRFVFMSGGAFSHRAREFFDALPSHARLEKPFGLSQLRAAVREASRRVSLR